MRNCVIHREVVIEEHAELTDCIIMDHVLIKRGARLQRTIVDRNNIIEPGTAIGHDVEADRARYHVTPAGITVVPEGLRGPQMISFLETYMLE